MSKNQQRLDKVLSHLGIASRSELKKWAKQGRIAVNGETVTDSGLRIDPEQDAIEVDGVVRRYRQFVYIMLNKPQGVVSATEDHRDSTVLDLLDPQLRAFDPFPVGRLDKDTEGLLLITNDGRLAHQLLSPRKHVPKTYAAIVEGEVNAGDVEQFKKGVALDDGYVTLPAALSIDRVDRNGETVRSAITLTIHEGKFHQVKRMFQAVGKRVVYLKRVRMGSLELDPELALGAYRELTEEELALLEQHSSAHGKRR